MKSKAKQAAELEAELLRLSALVRYRREQLGRLEQCPNKTCECRRIWRNHIEKYLVAQVGKVRQQVKSRAAVAASKKRK